ncbi:MAG: hypothetical protein ACREM3_23665 [Candidatus Rokuibacteriota bacterium]
MGEKSVPPVALESLRISAVSPVVGREVTPFSIHGAELAKVLGFLRSYNNLYHAIDGDAVNLSLRGLAQTLNALGSPDYDGETGDACLFLAEAVENLAARLEADDRPGDYRVECDASDTGAA